MLGVFGPKLAMLALCWPYVGFILALILWGSFFLEKKRNPSLWVLPESLFRFSPPVPCLLSWDAPANFPAAEHPQCHSEGHRLLLGAHGRWRPGENSVWQPKMTQMQQFWCATNIDTSKYIIIYTQINYDIVVPWNFTLTCVPRTGMCPVQLWCEFRLLVPFQFF